MHEAGEEEEFFSPAFLSPFLRKHQKDVEHNPTCINSDPWPTTVIWDDRWLTPGLAMQKKIVPLKKIFNRRLAVSLVSIPLPPYSGERLVP